MQVCRIQSNFFNTKELPTHSPSLSPRNNETHGQIPLKQSLPVRSFGWLPHSDNSVAPFPFSSTIFWGGSGKYQSCNHSISVLVVKSDRRPALSEKIHQEKSDLTALSWVSPELLWGLMTEIPLVLCIPAGLLGLCLWGCSVGGSSGWQMGHLGSIKKLQVGLLDKWWILPFL